MAADKLAVLRQDGQQDISGGSQAVRVDEFGVTAMVAEYHHTGFTSGGAPYHMVPIFCRISGKFEAFRREI